MPVYALPGFHEPVNSFLHLGAAGAFTALSIPLLKRSRGDRLRVALMSVFVFTAILMLAISGVFHMLARESAGGEVLLRLDKAAIFVLIAGTFTPVHGLLFSGAVRWVGLALMWLAAASGVTFMTIFFDRMPDGLSTGLYLALGWLAGGSAVVVWIRRGFRYIRELLFGGLAYSVGAILLGLKWPTLIPGYFGPHELWHIAVITGISLHWRFIVRLASEHRALRQHQLMWSA